METMRSKLKILLLIASSTVAVQVFFEAVALATELVESRGSYSKAVLETTSSTQLQLASNVSDAPINDSLAQVTSVSQLSDVQPTDWAFQALQSLVERYGCIAGYPDSTYRGNRALTRYEFAAGLNACLDRVNELIATATADQVIREDLVTLQRLQEEFAAEIATLRGRVDALEAQTAELEANQFSTTTVLNGEALFTIADVFGDQKADGEDLEVNPILTNRARLNFDTSFVGSDRLRIRLQARNITPFNTNLTGTNMTRLGADGDEGNDLQIDDLYYRFNVGNQTTVWLIGSGFGSDNIVANAFNPFLQSGSRGSISRFGRFHSIYRLSAGSGIGLTQRFGDVLSLSVSYRAGSGSSPTEKAGLFDGSYGALAQLTLEPSQNFGVGLTYVNYYAPGNVVNTTGSIGSSFATRPFDQVATLANAYGLEASWRVTPGFAVSGWTGYTNAQALSGSNQGSGADIWNWAVTLAFPDLGRQGNLAGFVVGMPPKVTNNDIGDRTNTGTSYHLEGFYRYQLTNNVDITPGVFVILNPEHNNDNNAIWVGTLRTTFRF